MFHNLYSYHSFEKQNNFETPFCENPLTEGMKRAGLLEER